jgi:hypothetical protein
MKKTTLMVIILVFSLILSACSSVTNNAQGAGATTISPSASQTAGGGEMTQVMKLALGTLMLEKTSYPVQAEQAKTLLILWKAARSLGGSDTVADEELTALVNQIQSSMTSDQMKEIDGMGISLDSMRTITEELGLNMGQGGGMGNLSPEAQATMQAARESGQTPQGGGFGGGDPGMMMGGGPGEFGGAPGGSNAQGSQSQASGSGASLQSKLGINSMLLDAVIQFLQTKVS